MQCAACKKRAYANEPCMRYARPSFFQRARRGAAGSGGMAVRAAEGRCWRGETLTFSAQRQWQVRQARCAAHARKKRKASKACAQPHACARKGKCVKACQCAVRAQQSFHACRVYAARKAQRKARRGKGLVRVAAQLQANAPGSLLSGIRAPHTWSR